MIARDEPSAAARTLLRELFAGAADTAADALEQAANRARAQGFIVLQVGVQQSGQVREVANFHAAIALQCARHGNPMAPTVIVSAGPLLSGAACASPADFLLALTLAIDGHRGMYAYACGSIPNRGEFSGLGAFIDPGTLKRARESRIDVTARLIAGDAVSVFEHLGDCEDLAAIPIAWGVLRAILITPE